MSGDRSWMYSRLQNGFITVEFVNGVTEFINFACSKTTFMWKNKIRYPCTRCSNNKFLDKDKVTDHILNRGFTRAYTIWSLHGEDHVGQSSRSRSRIEPSLRFKGDVAFREPTYEDEIENPYTRMVRDAMRPEVAFNHGSENESSFVEEDTNPNASSFYSLLSNAEEPLWVGCTKHTTLSAVSTLRNRPSSPSKQSLNINSIRSAANITFNTSIKNGSKAHAWISYDSRTTNLSVFLTYLKNPIFSGNSSLSYKVNLSKVLPEWVTVGFSSATGYRTEIHNIASWEFNSTKLSSGPDKRGGGGGGRGGVNIGAIVGGVIGGSLAVVGTILIMVFFWRKKGLKKKEEDSEQDDSIDREFEHGTGPKRFSFAELVRATNNFAEEGKLGEGGFGGVYKGFLSSLNSSIAVKRVSRISKQGKKEYIAEVKIITKLRHKNLVQLIGWCHEKGEFLLIYEFMPNGSLDSHLFGGQNPLSWAIRYKIALGLASALLYLHEEWEQTVIHRDIKSSNVMLDSNFNARLGDFGLARLMDQELGIKITRPAGTFGYMAPEYVSKGKASKASDIYSFGVVVLEIACGRRSIESKTKEAETSLLDWVWRSYENERLVNVADEKLHMDFDLEQMERLMIVGLWCAHPDCNFRPSIRQALQVLNFEAPLPNLPKKMPVPKYDIPATSSSSSSCEPLMSDSVLTVGR
ncbi:PREDICTED: L-type lectin-domain containing receptor kinase IX.1 [Theobroma cacao]|uniref:L-type lectin-domain containing receptor kinase IX.1 n=1 Tax=Theobroma cacao TaxID=3641 RepID=A0AB32VWT1_THECC|nr:PREDICTED: L-type lectin-domain containing receptor kinase IX.1 [Theobroma cacao]